MRDICRARKISIGSRRQEAFTLPTVVIISVIMLTLMALALQMVSATSSALRTQYYQQLAREGAEAGLLRANQCIEKYNSAGWSVAGKPLKPNTDCNGTVNTSLSQYIASSGRFRITYEVGVVTVVDGRKMFSVNSALDTLRPSGDVETSYAATANNLSSNVALPEFSGGAGWAEDDHVAIIKTVDGRLFGFGANTYSQLTDGATPTNVLSPTELSLPLGISSIKKMSTSGQGASGICIIGNNDQVYCRGGSTSFSAGYWSKLNLPLTPANLKAYDMSLNGYGDDTVCVKAGVTEASAQAYCAGTNFWGQLGNGSRTDIYPSSNPSAILSKFILPGSLTVKKVHTQNSLTCVIASDDQLYCAGRSEDGQIAGTDDDYVTTPKLYKIPKMGSVTRKVKDVLMEYHGDELAMMVLATDGTIWASGNRADDNYPDDGMDNIGITGNGSKNGVTGTSPADLWGSAPADSAKRWATGGVIRVTSSPNKCIDNNGGSLSNGSKVQIWSCDESTNAQRWFYAKESKAIWLPLSGGTGSNFCLDLNGGNTANGSKIQIWSCDGSTAQQWELRDDGTIRYAANTTKCIDIPGGNANNGVQLIIYNCNGENGQKFTVDSRVKPFEAIIAQNRAFCGLRDDGTSGIWCSGSNKYGQLANYFNSTNSHSGQCSMPQGYVLNVNAGPGIKVDISKLSREWQYQYDSLQFIATDGNVYGAGRNIWGKLGNGFVGGISQDYAQCTTVKYILPAGVKALDMSARDEFTTYVLGSDGNIYASGLNSNGQLGVGTYGGGTSSDHHTATPLRAKIDIKNLIY